MGLLILIAVVLICGAVALGCWAYCANSSTSRTIAIVLTVVCIIGSVGTVIYAINGTESGKRWKKDLSSDLDGGLQRTVTVYDINSNVLKTYSGKMDIKENDGEKVVFVMKGQKYMIYKSDVSTVIVEEKDMSNK